MSFAEELLDGFDVLSKRTSASLDELKSDCFKKFSKDISGTCNKFKTKKLNSFMDGSLKNSITTIVDSLETTLCEPFNSIHDSLQAFSSESDSYVKENEQSRKKLCNEAASCKKDMTNMVAQLKKARDHYHKSAKEAQQAVNGGKGQKADSLSKKALEHDQKYREALELTNAKQDIHYSTEQPTILRQFQRWEEARIDFMNRANSTFNTSLQSIGLDSTWSQLIGSIAAAVDSVNKEEDIRIYANAARADIGQVTNTPYEYEPSPDGGPTVGAPPVAASPRTRARPAGGMERNDSFGGGSSSSGAAPAGRRAPPVPSKSYPSSSESAQEQRGEGEETYGDQGYDEGEGYGDGEEEGEEYKVLFDYTPVNEGEMEIHTGDVVLITEKDESGWWFGTCNGNEGYIPSDYVEQL